MFEAPRQIQSAAVGSSDVIVGLTPLAKLDFQKIGSNLWRGKTTILVTTAVALFLALLFVVAFPHRYTATTQILIEPTDLRAVANELTSPNQMNDAAVLQVESQVRVLTSDSVLRRVVKAEDLDNDPEFVRGALPFVSSGESESSLRVLAALNELRRHIQVKRPERTYVVDVSVTSADPVKAAHIANAVAQAYLAEQTEARSNAARQVSQSLSARLKDLKERVHQAEERVEAFKANNNIVGANGQLLNVSEQQLTDLNKQLAAARARTATAKARLDQVERLQLSKSEIGAFPEAVQSQTITALRSQYAEIMRREAEQMTSLGERHPAVIEIQAQAERLRRMIEDEVHRIALAARGEYESARADEETLTRNVKALEKTAITTNASLVGLRELERDVQANRAIYEAFLVRARETGEQEQLDTKNIRVISRADLPLRRSWPPSGLLVGFAALILGAATGAGMAIMRPPSAQWSSPPLGIGVLRNLVKAAGDFWPIDTASSPIPVLAVLPNVDISFGLNAVEDPKSLFATEIRKVHDAVRASHKTHGNPSILVAASVDEDDTAAVALTLAAEAAATQRVLLIDADLQRRTLSAIDADQNEAGLVDVATGRRELSDVIVCDRETNVNLVSFVSPNSRRDRRISEEDIKQAFDQTKRFDMVIVAAVDLSADPSTRFFAGVVDHIVLVTRADEESEDAVDKFMARLGLDAGKVRGAVLIGRTSAPSSV